MKSAALFSLLLMVGCNSRNSSITMTAPDLPAESNLKTVSQQILFPANEELLNILQLPDERSIPQLRTILKTNPDLNELVDHPYLKEKKVTLFTAATLIGSLKEIETLLEGTPNLSTVDPSGHTVMSHNIMLGRIDIIELLLKHDYDGMLVQPVNDIALPILALKIGNIELSKKIIALLVAHQAPVLSKNQVNNYILPIYLQAERIGQQGIDFSNRRDDLKNEIAQTVSEAIHQLGEASLHKNYPNIYSLGPLDYLKLRVCRYAPELESLILKDLSLSCSPK